MKKTTVVLSLSTILLLAPITGCRQDAMEPVLSDMPFMPMSVAAGNNAVMNFLAEIDVSNTQNGYVMVRYLEKTDTPLKVVIKSPRGTSYIFNLRSDGEYETLPLSEGDGYYQITVYKNVVGKTYSAVIGTTKKVQLADELSPFVRPNQYVNYNADGKAAKKAAELTKGSKSAIDKISAVYNYIINNITYDYRLSETVQRGYIPDVDKVLRKGKGICFDYAALMAAMLRSQGIPAKLVVGYKGNDYHAWISAYSNETGWINGAVFFDGKGWTLMDPTFASAYGNSADVSKHIGNYYAPKYIY